MRTFAIAGAAIAAMVILQAPAKAAVAQNIAPAGDAVSVIEKASCYRLGLTGYHRYRSCFGPAFLYPHRRICRRGYCWYR
jgi:hypothetical protein